MLYMKKNKHFTYVVHIYISEFRVKKNIIYITSLFLVNVFLHNSKSINVVFLTIRVVKAVTTSITAHPVVSNSDHLIIVGWTCLPNTSMFAKGNRKHGRQRLGTL